MIGRLKISHWKREAETKGDIVIDAGITAYVELKAENIESLPEDVRELIESRKHSAIDTTGETYTSTALRDYGDVKLTIIFKDDE